MRTKGSCHGEVKGTRGVAYQILLLYQEGGEALIDKTEPRFLIIRLHRM